MINKDKIRKVFIYDDKGTLIITTKTVTFPKDFFKMRNKDMVMIKGSRLPLIPKSKNIEVIFEYLNGTRMKYETIIDISTEKQINFHVDEGIELDERRHFFKVEIEIKGIAQFYMRGEEMHHFDPPLKVQFKNINIGGVFALATPEITFEKGDQVMFTFLEGTMDLLSEVLRVQQDDTGKITGYGCRFVAITSQQEEKIARFLFDCQMAERGRLRKKEGIE